MPAKEKKMKRILAVATFAVLGIVALTLWQQRENSSFEAQAQTTKAKVIQCVPPSGKFAYSADGQLLSGNGGPDIGPVAFAGYMEFSDSPTSPHHVKGTDAVNYSDTGIQDRAYSGTYTKQADCSFQAVLNFGPNGTAPSGTISLYLADSGKEFRFVQRDKFRIIAGSARRIN
jgi:hypothetical protein